MLFRNFLAAQPVVIESSDLKNPSGWFLELFGGHNKTSAGENVTIDSALTVPTVYACVNILANSIAKLPFQTYKKTRSGRERDSSHPVAQLLETRPNPFQSPFRFKHLVETHRNTWGNAYINFEWRPDGRPESLWLLDPSKTEPVMDRETRKLWYVVGLPDGNQAKIPSGDIIHLTTLSTDGLKGKSPIQLAREAIGGSIAGQKYKGRFYQNNATPSGVLKVPGALDKPSKEKLRGEWEKMQSGVTNANRIAILDSGLEFQSIGMPLKDAQFIESMKYDKAEIAGLYNIPMHMVNDLERATHSNIEQQALDFIQHTLSPIVVQYEQEFAYSLFSTSEMKRYYLKVNLNSMLRADSKSRAEFYREAINNSWMNADEVRALEDMDPIPNGLGEKYLVSLNYTTLENLEEYQRAKAGLATKGGDE